MTASENPLVLVTGSAGRLGRAVVNQLCQRGYLLRGLDRVATPGLPTEAGLIGDISNADTMARALAGVHTVIHLAACPDDASFPRRPAPQDTDNFLTELLPANVVGVYQVMEAARRHGVSRVVLASTVQTVFDRLESGPFPIRVSDPPMPRYWYAVTKVFLEQIGAVYARRHGLTVLAVRIGWCPRESRQEAEIAASPSAQDIYFSPGDAGRFFAAAVEAALPSGSFHVVFAASRPRGIARLDLEPARALLGYTPLDTWPEGIDSHR